MALRRILTQQDETLYKVCRPVTEFGDRTAQLLDDLRETLADAKGAGLAAPQVGIRRRAAVIVNKDEMVDLLNPEIIARSDEQVGLFEACLSCPGLRGYLERPRTVTVRAQDRTGAWFDLECEDIAARAACHEIDHLDGILFIDLVEEVIPEEELEEAYEEAFGVSGDEEGV